MSKKIDLKQVLETTGADAVLIADKDGNLIEAINVEHDKNIAAMTEMAFSMCRDLSSDLQNGDLDQLFAKSSNGFFIANKLNSEHILMLLSRDNSKLGLLLKLIGSISK